MLNVWVNPWATNLALYLSTKPSKFNFTMKTHLRPIVVFPAGNASTLQVWFFLRALISSSIASFHFGTFRAFCTLLGISTLDNWKVKSNKRWKEFRLWHKFRKQMTSTRSNTFTKSYRNVKIRKFRLTVRKWKGITCTRLKLLICPWFEIMVVL